MKVVLDMREWETWLERAQKTLGKVAELLEVASKAFAFQDIINHFREEAGPTGKWPKRAPATDLRYRMIQMGIWRPPAGGRQGSYNPSNKLLQLTGQLRQSLMPVNGQIERASGDSVRLFSNDPKGGRHEYGGRGVPARSFMWLSDKAQDKMVDAIAQVVAGETGGI